MSPVEFKQKSMSCQIFFLSLNSMSHVDFKKLPCHPVEFKGQAPLCAFGHGGGDGTSRQLINDCPGQLGLMMGGRIKARVSTDQ